MMDLGSFCMKTYLTYKLITQKNLNPFRFPLPGADIINILLVDKWH